MARATKRQVSRKNRKHNKTRKRVKYGGDQADKVIFAFGFDGIIKRPSTNIANLGLIDSIKTIKDKYSSEFYIVDNVEQYELNDFVNDNNNKLKGYVIGKGGSTIEDIIVHLHNLKKNATSLVYITNKEDDIRNSHMELNKDIIVINVNNMAEATRLMSNYVNKDKKHVTFGQNDIREFFVNNNENNGNNSSSSEGNILRRRPGAMKRRTQKKTSELPYAALIFDFDHTINNIHTGGIHFQKQKLDFEEFFKTGYKDTDFSKYLQEGRVFINSRGLRSNLIKLFVDGESSGGAKVNIFRLPAENIYGAYRSETDKDPIYAGEPIKSDTIGNDEWATQKAKYIQHIQTRVGTNKPTVFFDDSKENVIEANKINNVIGIYIESKKPKDTVAYLIEGFKSGFEQFKMKMQSGSGMRRKTKSKNKKSKKRRTKKVTRRKSK